MPKIKYVEHLADDARSPLADALPKIRNSSIVVESLEDMKKCKNKRKSHSNANSSQQMATLTRNSGI